MAKTPSKADQGVPTAEPQGTPRDLYPTSDIRFVMMEVAKLTERLDHLIKNQDELKAGGRETRDRLFEIEKGISFVKGAMWVLGGLFALTLVVVGVILRASLGS